MFASLLVLSAARPGLSDTGHGSAPVPEPVPGPFDALFYQYRLLARDLLARRCIFAPSCSSYGQRAVRERGPVLGTMMALERWLRCRGSARMSEYYVPAGRMLFDPLEVPPGTYGVTWDSLLLPF